MVVTVKCGHCTSLLSVNMVKASFVPLHLFRPSHINQSDHHQIKLQGGEVSNPGVVEKELEYKHSPSPVDEEDDYDVPVNLVFNKPPEKRQRAPSAYNCFIKQEIRRLKAKNPDMAHKQAFSTAAKNWAHFPPSRHKGEEERCSQGEKIRQSSFSNDEDDEVHEEGNGFRERKASKHHLSE